MIFDQYEIYRRGAEDAPRPELTGPLPFPGTPDDHDYMTPYPRAHVIPVGNGQRSDAEAKRLVDFLLANDIEVTAAAAGLPLRRADLPGGLVRRLDGPGAARARQHDAGRRRRHLRPRDAAVRAARRLEQRLPLGSRRGHDRTRPALHAEHAPGRARPTRSRAASAPAASDWLALEVDSRTAVRTANELIGAGVRGTARARAVRDARAATCPRAASCSRRASGADPRRRPRGGPLVRARERPAAAARGDRAGAADRLPVLGARELGARDAARLLRRPVHQQQHQLGREPIRSANYDVIYNTNQNYPADTPGERHACAPATRRSSPAAAATSGRGSAAPTSWRRTPAAHSSAGLQAEWQGRQLAGGQGDRGGR